MREAAEGRESMKSTWLDFTLMIIYMQIVNHQKKKFSAFARHSIP